jgi:FeS assembly SUF system protein
MTKEEMITMVVDAMRTVFDIEIPVNIYDLGLIYDIDITDDYVVKITMTLTSPNCPVAESLPIEVHDAVKAVKGVKDVNVEITFEPPWDPSKISDDAKLELGLL